MLTYCPYCFEKFSASFTSGPQLDLICRENWGKKRKGEKSEHLVTIPYMEWKKWGRKGTLPSCPGQRTHNECDGCPGMPLSQRACPFCHTPIRNSMIDKENLQLAIVGTRNSGKTVFITMLMDYLRLKMGNVYENPMVPMEAAEGDRITRVINQMKQGEMPQNTTIDDVKPRLYQYGVGNKLKVLTIFDGAGEKFSDETLEAALMRYVTYASGLILLFDPTVIPEVRKELIPSHGGTGEITNATMEDVLKGIQLTYETYNQLNGNALNKLFKRSSKLSIPVAVVFSKFDLMFEYFNQGDAVVNKSPNMNPNTRRFDEADAEMVDKEVRHWLKQVGDNGLIKSIDECFSNVRFFGVSSLGCSPGKNSSYSPHRIADPILWLMHCKGLID